MEIEKEKRRGNLSVDVFNLCQTVDRQRSDCKEGGRSRGSWFLFDSSCYRCSEWRSVHRRRLRRWRPVMWRHRLEKRLFKNSKAYQPRSNRSVTYVGSTFGRSVVVIVKTSAFVSQGSDHGAWWYNRRAGHQKIWRFFFVSVNGFFLYQQYRWFGDCCWTLGAFIKKKRAHL